MGTFLSPGEIVNKYIDGCDGKVKSGFAKLIGKSVLAGAFIGFGAAGSSVAAHAIADVGVARLVAGCVFPVGLMMVILMGAELFTGDCLMMMGTINKRHSILDLIRVLASVYFGNFIGGTVLAAMVYYCGQFNYSGGLLGAYTIKVAIAKVSIAPGPALVSGILCNLLVCAAVIMALASTDITGKLLACFFVIMLFVTSGFEHCVANMYYITAGLFAKLNPEYINVCVEQYGITQSQLDSLNIGTYFINNLVPVTIGNILGGGVFLGIPLAKLNK